MDEQQIQIVSLQFFHGFLNGCFCFFIAGIGDPYFGGQKKFFTRQTAGSECGTYAFLVVIRLCSVDAAVADLNGIEYAALGVLRCGNCSGS